MLQNFHLLRQICKGMYMISQKLSLYQIFVRYFAIGLPISQIVELFVSKQATSSKPSHCSHNLTSLCKQKQPAKKNNSKVDSQMRQTYLHHLNQLYYYTNKFLEISLSQHGYLYHRNISPTNFQRFRGYSLDTCTTEISHQITS